ncbi:short chain dehydrogenase [Ceratobasidium sp. AG-Ba]|nr:short chain dehydrogenase [Ceratobasidium sp. AG-Ba]
MSVFNASRLQNKTVLNCPDDHQCCGKFGKDVPQELRDVDILVNNAGSCLAWKELERSRTRISSLCTYRRMYSHRPETNGSSGYPDFKKRQTGHFINIGSVAGREPYVGGSIYCATKHAVSAFTGSLMRELVDTPIRVTEIQPGMVETDFSVTRYRGDKSAADKVYTAFSLVIVAEDIAEEIVWAAARPPHVNLAQVYVLPVNQASATLSYRKPQ